MIFSRMFCYDECCVTPAIPFLKGNLIKNYISNTEREQERESLFSVFIMRS